MISHQESREIPWNFIKHFTNFLNRLKYRCTTTVQQYFIETKSTKTMNQALLLYFQKKEI